MFTEISAAERILLNPEFHIQQFLSLRFGWLKIPPRSTRDTINVFISICGWLRWAGMDADGIKRCLAITNTRLCTRPIKKSKFSSLHNWAVRRWKPGGSVPDSRYTEERMIIAEMSIERERYQWAGAAGVTDRKVITVFHNIAWRSSKLFVSASVRQVALKAGISLPTAVASLRRLQERQWIEKIEQGRTSRASFYRLIMPTKPLTNQSRKVPASLASVKGYVSPAYLNVMAADQWRYGGQFGPVGLWTVQKLNELGGQASLSKLAEVMHRNRRSVLIALRRLRDAGVVRHAKSGQWELTGERVSETYEKRRRQGIRFIVDCMIERYLAKKKGVRMSEKVIIPSLQADDILFVRNNMPRMFEKLLYYKYLWYDCDGNMVVAAWR